VHSFFIYFELGVISNSISNTFYYSWCLVSAITFLKVINKLITYQTKLHS